MGIRRVMSQLGRAIWREKATWLVPLLLVLVGLVAFILLTEGGAVKPLLYSIF